MKHRTLLKEVIKRGLSITLLQSAGCLKTLLDHQALSPPSVTS